MAEGGVADPELLQIEVFVDALEACTLMGCHPPLPVHDPEATGTPGPDDAGATPVHEVEMAFPRVDVEEGDCIVYILPACHHPLCPFHIHLRSLGSREGGDRCS